MKYNINMPNAYSLLIFYSISALKSMKGGIVLNDISKKIKSIRLNNKLRQTDFAEMICISQSYLSRLESGQKYPSKTVIRLISLQFGIDENFFKEDINELNS